MGRPNPITKVAKILRKFLPSNDFLYFLLDFFFAVFIYMLCQISYQHKYGLIVWSYELIKYIVSFLHKISLRRLAIAFPL